MKTRLFAFLAAVAVGSAAVLIYASQSTGTASASLAGADDCSACEVSAAQPAMAASVKATDECCPTEAAQSAVATLAADGCPYSTGAAPAALVADVTSAPVAASACCAAGAAPVAAQVEK